MRSSCRLSFFRSLLLAAAHGAFGLLDQALDHVTADITGLTAGHIAVIALIMTDMTRLFSAVRFLTKTELF